MKISIDELAKASSGKIVFGNSADCFENITTSSNLIKGKDLFVPIVGEKTDGHLYIASAFEKGAAVSFTEKNEPDAGLNPYRDTKALIQVKNSVAALQQFAGYFRKTYVSIPYIGITGSVGKTTTREMIAAALSGCMPVYSTKGNANSQVGVPITVFETDPEAKIGVLELGISEFGEMEKISRIADVELALITNIGISHIAQFKTQENILKEKLMILSGSKEEVTLLVNGDDPLLRELTEETIHAMGIAQNKRITVYRYGLNEENDFRAVKISKERGPADFVFSAGKDGAEVPVSLSVYGDHMILNATAAMAAAELLGIDLEKSAQKLGSFEGFEGRGKLLERNGVTFINDCYNASPVSMRSGLSVFHEMPVKGKKIAVLADMKELGDNELNYHLEIGEFINHHIGDLNVLITYGPMAALIGETVNQAGNVEVHSFTDRQEAKDKLYSIVKPGDLVFLKGSWSMGLKDLLQE